jgi:hypothetical protein
MPTSPYVPCPTPNPFTGASCKRKGCPVCGHAWAASWEAVIRLNLEEYARPVALVAITAPGKDVLPWSCSRDHRHSGPRGCRVKADHADVWAAHCRQNWTRLRDAARASCRRAGLNPRLLGRVWEPQKRGVPHLHVAIGLATPEERAAARLFVDELARLAPEYVFGHVDRKLRPVSGREAARYVAGYLMGRSKRKRSIRDNLADPRMPRSLVWITPTLTRTTRVTMRTLRYARWYFAALAGRCPQYPELRGQVLVDVARAASRLERSRAPGVTPDDRFRVHFRTLATLRTLAIDRYAGRLAPVALPASVAA